MDPVLHDELLEGVRNRQVKQDTNVRNSLTVDDKLAVTLRFLASGASYMDLMYSFRISVAAIAKFVPEVCGVIYRRISKVAQYN